MGLGTRKSLHSVKMEFDLWKHLSIGLLIRFLLSAYGDSHDRQHAVKYTDVDYYVFTDAAREITLGNSPFDRHTYRYTPFLAALLIPNVKFNILFGKILFSIIDVLCSKLIFDILDLEGFQKRTCGWACLLWLYNPLVIGISTRGSADCISALLILSLVYFLRMRLPILSGVMLGIAVHFKLYPIIYSLPIYLSFTPRYQSGSLINMLMPNWNKIRFVCGTVGGFLGPTISAMILYEDQYIEESFLYHFSRIDTRHNFSVYFYLLYLCADKHIPMLSVATFAPQAFLVAAIGFRYSLWKDLSFGMFAQTVAFVTFNKVVTSQYFIWYLVLLPVVAPRIRFTKLKALLLTVLWIVAQVSWLLPAYLLEFQSVNAFVPLWLESIAFFCCNNGILMAFISSYDSVTNPQATKKNK